MYKRHGIWLKILTLSGISLGISACDTVAELTFEDEQIIELIPQGLVSKDCLSVVESETPHDSVFRFSVITSFDAHLTPGARYSALGEPLVPNQNFKAADVQFSDGWFFIAETASRDKTCTETADCPVGASCLSVDEMGLSQYYYAKTEKYCVYPTTIEVVDAPHFSHYRDNPLPGNTYVSSSLTQGRTIAFMLDNSASLDGSALTGIPDQTKATDPWQFRKVGLNQFMDGLNLTTDTKPKYEFSAHFANGTGKQGVYDISPAWMKTEAVWNATVMDKYPSPAGYSPIWETAAASLQKIQDTSNVSYTHTMIAFTDGAPGEGTDDSFSEFSRLIRVSQIDHLHWLDYEPDDQPPHMRYAEMTALTCGSYYLLENPAQIPHVMRQLAINSESSWDAGIHFSAELPQDHVYRLATDIVVKLGNTAVAYSAQRTNDDQNEIMDHRLVFSK